MKEGAEELRQAGKTQSQNSCCRGSFVNWGKYVGVFGFIAMPMENMNRIF